MKNGKKLFHGFFWLMNILLLLMPIYLIYHISRDEIKQYAPKSAPVFRETAYGAVEQARRADVQEAVTVSGICTSDAFAYTELTQRNIQNARWYVREGDEVRQGQAIAMLEGKEILSEHTGILREINLYAKDPYLKTQLLEPVEVECFVNARTLNAVRFAGDALQTENGETVTLTDAALTKSSNGTTRIRLQVDSEVYSYGMEVRELKLMTGKTYLSALVLNAKCLYQKEPGSEEWYVRRVTADGFFIEELRVDVGYSNGKIACVSGVNEGDYFDSGYRTLVEGGTGGGADG